MLHITSLQPRSMIAALRIMKRSQMAAPIDDNNALTLWRNVAVNLHHRLRNHSSRKLSIDSIPQEFETSKDFVMRHTGIITHPDSIAAKILPGNVILRTLKTGTKKLKITESEYGNFWMMKDLTMTGEKPILANDSLIDEKFAKVFPILKGARNLTGTVVDFPAHCLRKNRLRDAGAQCTLLAISFRDFGFQQLPSWVDPFTEALGNRDRVEVMKINISNGWFDRFFLRPIIAMLTKRNTEPKEHNNTFLYFGKTDQLCDALRMRNVLAGYIFLLDGLGRVRFAGSGVATDDEVSKLIISANNLLPSRLPHRQYDVVRVIESSNEAQPRSSKNHGSKPGRKVQ